MSGADRLDDGFPHGTTQGYTNGCRGGWCPAGNEHGLSCSRAKQLSAGDYQYQRLAKQGRTPSEIAFELGLAPETHAAPRKESVVPGVDDEEVIDLEGDEEPMKINTKSTKPVPIPPTASGRTKAELAEIRQWAKDNGVAHTVTGRMPRATIAAYDAAHAPAQAPADDRPKPMPPRKLQPMKPVEQPAALKEPAAHELSSVAEAIQVAIVHGAVAPDMETRAKLFNEGWEAAEDSYGPVVDDLVRAEASLEFVLQKWGEESHRRRAQSVLLRSMARQVILAEQERRDDAELLAGMDKALAEAYERIAQLTAELAARPEPWWKRFAS
jgi:hypothetical protein